MEVDKTLICRLCFEICKNNFQVVSDASKDTLSFLLINLDLDVSKEPVICNNCTENLEECFNFKMACLHKMDDVAIKSESVELKVPNKRLDEIVADATEILNSSNICCSCAKLVNNETSVLLTNEEKNVTTMLEKYLPELVLNGTMNSMCMACYKSLQNYLTFISNCITVEEKIKEYCVVEGTNSSGQVDLRNVLSFMPKAQLQSDIYNSFSAVKMGQGCEDTKVEDEFKAEEAEVYSTEKSDIVVKMEEDGDDRVDAYPTMLESCVELQLLNQNTTSAATNLFKCGRCEYHSECQNELSQHKCPHKSGSVLLLYKCKTCTYQTTRKDNFSRHMIVHKQPSEATMYNCDLCPYVTRHKNGLVQHMLTHRAPLEVTLYKCKLCPYQAKRKSNLSDHLRSHEDPSKLIMYKCEICPYQSRRKWHLPRHVLTHKYLSEVPTFKCELCPYESKARWNLSQHMLTHQNPSEVTMYKCKLCAYQSKLNRNLSKHMLMHKDPSEVKMYKCELCPYQTKRTYGLTKHMVIHKNLSEITIYQCEVCSFQTKRKTSLKVHMIRHRNDSEVRMYNCGTCSFQTRQKGNLKLHALLHKTTSDIKMYKCEMCELETKYRSNLRLHVRRRHKEKSM